MSISIGASIGSACATIPAAQIAGCIDADDGTLMAEARNACSRLAKVHLRERSGGIGFDFHPQQNTSSDPTLNAFEFVWSDSDIAGIDTVTPRSVVCRGAADRKIITLLSVGDDQIVASPQAY